jgi:hypothetical protein
VAWLSEWADRRDRKKEDDGNDHKSGPAQPQAVAVSWPRMDVCHVHPLLDQHHHNHIIISSSSIIIIVIILTTGTLLQAPPGRTESRLLDESMPMYARVRSVWKLVLRELARRHGGGWG